MAYRVLIAIVLMVVGLSLVAIPASAAPSYGAPGVATVTVSDSTVNLGDSVLFSGEGFDPNEGIRVEVSFVGPNGLRGSSALTQLTVAKAYTTVADGNGHFQQEVLLDQLGTATLTAIGLTSGKTLSLTVQVGPEGSNGGSAPTTTIAAGPGANTVTVSDPTVNVGDNVLFSGEGFAPNEGITIEVSYLGPNGRTVVKQYTAQADGNGHFQQEVLLDQLGTATLTATGLVSGKTLSLIVQVGPEGSNGGSAPTTTVAAGPGSSSAGGSGLAYTGASIFGPLAIGAAALFAGLGMLFFGTRGAIRRKRPTPTPNG